MGYIRLVEYRDYSDYGSVDCMNYSDKCFVDCRGYFDKCSVDYMSYFDKRLADLQEYTYSESVAVQTPNRKYSSEAEELHRDQE